jgi:hypothetical protein
MRDARYPQSEKIWNKFTPMRKETIYKIVFEQRWSKWLENAKKY